MSSMSKGAPHSEFSRMAAGVLLPCGSKRESRGDAISAPVVRRRKGVHDIDSERLAGVSGIVKLTLGMNAQGTLPGTGKMGKKLRMPGGAGTGRGFANALP